MSKREVCQKCKRPQRVCFCEGLPSQKYALPHPKEAKQAYNSCSLLQLVLDNLEVIRGRQFEPILNQNSYLVYPTSDSISNFPTQPENIIFIDGTWKFAKEIYKRNTWLHSLPSISLPQPENLIYTNLRKAPNDNFMSLAEAVAHSFSLIGYNEAFQGIISTMQYQIQVEMNARQLINKIYGTLGSLFWSKKLDLSVIGLQNAGKSTFINVLATSQFDEDSIPTIGFNHRQLKKGGVDIQIWDIGGQPRFRESWEKYCRGADCIIFIVDSADFSCLDEARAQLHQLLQWPSLTEIPLLVLGNKNDLEGALNEEELIYSLNLQSIMGRAVSCYSVSAKNMNNIDITLEYLTKLAKK